MIRRNESDAVAVLDDFQQAAGLVRLQYADGLYDSQIDLRISKNKDRETISARYIRGISLRGLTENGWVYINTNRIDRSTHSETGKGPQEEKERKRGRIITTRTNQHRQQNASKD